MDRETGAPRRRENGAGTGRGDLGDKREGTVNTQSRSLVVALLCLILVTGSFLASGCGKTGGAKLPEDMPRDFTFAAYAITDVAWDVKASPAADGSWEAEYTYAEGGYVAWAQGKATKKVLLIPRDEARKVYDRLRQIRFLKFPEEPLGHPETSDSITGESFMKNPRAYGMEVDYDQVAGGPVHHEVRWWETDKADGTVQPLREALAYIKTVVERSAEKTKP